MAGLLCGLVGYALLLPALMIGVGGPGAVHADVPDDDAPLTDEARFKQLGDDLQQAYAAARVALRELPLEETHPHARQAAIGADAEALFAWVRDETRWLPYRGALRGARGTLMDRMGSHLDRTLLLATMLDAAGHDVRLAHAELTDAEVDALTAIVTADLPARPEAEAGTAGAGMDRVVNRAAQHLGIDAGEQAALAFEADLNRQQLTERVVQQGVTQSQSLARLLAWDDDDDDADPAADELDAATSAALRDHWWVQVETADGWLDLDPARRSHEPGERAGAAEPETYALDALPDDHRHTLRIEVVAEQLAEGELTEHVALSHDVFATEMTGQVMALAIEAVDLPSPAALFGAEGEHDVENLPALVAEQTEWLPILNVGGAMEGGKSIMADGSVNEQPGQMAQGRAMEEASGLLGALGGRGDDAAEAETHLTAVFVRFTVEAPGRAAERFERPVMDVLGPAARADEPAAFELSDAKREQRAFAMLGSMRVMGQTGWLPETYAVGRSLQGVLDNQMAVLGALHAFRGGDAEQAAAALERQVPQPGGLLTLAHQRQAMSPHREAVALTRLNLLSEVRVVDWRDGDLVRTEGFDIIQNAVDVLPGSEADPRAVRLTQGVLETVLEAELLSAEADVDVINTGRRYAEALASDEAWRVIADEQQLEAIGGQIDADTRTHLRQALADGQAVVLPNAPGAGEPLMWWRVDVATGAALGMGPSGRGQAGVESLIMLVEMLDTAFGVASTVVSMWDCLFSNAGDNEAIECCARRTAFTAGASLAFGAASSRMMHTIDQVIFGYLFGQGVEAATPNPC
ncbi:MAG: hypothetical protein WDZ31_13090 [Phycisphaeraceae bacterium]